MAIYVHAFRTFQKFKFFLDYKKRIKTEIRKVVNSRFREFSTYCHQFYPELGEIINSKALLIFPLQEQLVGFIFEHYHLHSTKFLNPNTFQALNEMISKRHSKIEELKGQIHDRRIAIEHFFRHQEESVRASFFPTHVGLPRKAIIISDTQVLNSHMMLNFDRFFLLGFFYLILQDIRIKKYSE